MAESGDIVIGMELSDTLDRLIDLTRTARTVNSLKPLEWWAVEALRIGTAVRDPGGAWLILMGRGEWSPAGKMDVPALDAAEAHVRAAWRPRRAAEQSAG